MTPKTYKTGEGFDWMREHPGEVLVASDGYRWKFEDRNFYIIQDGQSVLMATTCIGMELYANRTFTAPEPEKLPEAWEDALRKIQGRYCKHTWPARRCDSCCAECWKELVDIFQAPLAEMKKMVREGK